MKIHLKPILTCSVMAALLFSCNTEKKNKKDMTNETHHGLDIQYMDTTVSPKQDFYSYVNGKWNKETEIPSDRKSWGSFQILAKNTDKNVLNLLKENMENNKFKEGSDQEKAVLLYKSKLDTVAREKAGLAPLKPAMEKIDGIKDLKSLQEILSEDPYEISNPFFGISGSALFENSAMNGAFMGPGRLGLPDRDYYTDKSKDAEKIRQQYVDHITRMFKLWGDDEEVAKDKAQRILALETKLAEPKMTKEERRNTPALNNPRTIAQIQKMTPEINWEKWIEDLPVKKDIDTIIVTQPKYMKALGGILKNTDIKDLRTLVSWATLNSAASVLTPEMDKANWDFYSKTLNGVPKRRPAEERALSTVNSVLGEALGKIYVEKYFPPEAKKMATEMIQDVIDTYKKRIKNLSWMDDSTKKKAIEKLDKFTIKLGYPDKWKDYSNMEVNKDNSYYQNMIAVSKWAVHRNLSKINEPVDKTEWFMNPQTVNAYFNPSANEIVFPAAILQKPFFDYQADPAVNFGGMGAVIGHEISHSFDDSGARFDADGNLKDWWTEEDQEQFKKKTQQLKDFYNSVKVKGEDDLHLNGDYTVGENAADLGGVTAAYHAMMDIYFKKHKKPGKIDGLTQAQRFFMSWATVWRTKARKEAIRTQIKTDPHSPGYYRSYLPLQNVDEFYKAFDIQPGDSMYVAPEDRVKIW